MMRVQLLSDLHFEFHADDGRAFVESLDPADVDVLVLAGDIAVGDGVGPALDLFCARYGKARVLYVHGNHEFYGCDRAAVVATTENAAARHANLSWLDCDVVEVNGQRFLGTPLWFPQDPVATSYEHLMNDFTQIRDYRSWVYAQHERARSFLETELRVDDVVVTHHLPSQASVAPRFKRSPLTPFFVGDVEGLLRERRPQLWMHGHTHESLRYEVGDTTVLCNPFGYVRHELNPKFEDQCVTVVP